MAAGEGGGGTHWGEESGVKQMAVGMALLMTYRGVRVRQGGRCERGMGVVVGGWVWGGHNMEGGHDRGMRGKACSECGSLPRRSNYLCCLTTHNQLFGSPLQQSACSIARPAHTPRVQLSVHNVSASWHSKLGQDRWVPSIGCHTC